MVADQIDAVLEDFDVAAIKIGMLGMAAIVEVAAERLPSPHSPSRDRRPLERPIARRETGVLSNARWGRGDETHLPQGEGRRAFIVYDPVIAASSGDPLSGAGFVEAVRARLLPLVDCLTPNLVEAAALLGEPVARSEAGMARQGEALLKLGPRAVLMKGGHLKSEEVIDLMVTEGDVRRFAAPWLLSKNLHGTGCTLSSAIAANIVLGASLPEAVAAAKAFVRQAIERGRGVALGSGAGPLIQIGLRSKLLTHSIRIRVSLKASRERIWADMAVTCFAPSVTEHGHVHFVDGAGGGYTMAAKAMKARRDALASAA